MKADFDKCIKDINKAAFTLQENNRKQANEINRLRKVIIEQNDRIKELEG